MKYAAVLVLSLSLLLVSAYAERVSVFTYSPASPIAGQPVTFDASQSVCSSGPCTYNWVDDADNSSLGNGPSLTFTFQGVGIKYVHLTITDTLGRTASIEHDVPVTTGTAPPPPPPPVPPPTTTYFISLTGSDAAAGSLTAPWKTIQKAADTVMPGSTVIVNAGNYPERVVISRSGTTGNWIAFQAMGTVVTRGFNVSADYIKVDGFEMTLAASGGYANRAGGSGVFLAGKHNQISNNYIHHTNAAGLYMTGAADDNRVTANRISYAVECAIYINGTSHLVSANDISHIRSVGGSDADGIRFFGSGSTVQKNTIHDMFLNDSPGDSPHIDAFQTWGPATGYVFEQNLIDKQPSHQQGFTIENINAASLSVGNIVIRNNVFITRGTGYQPDINVGDLGTVTNVTIANNTMVAINGTAEWAIWLFTGLKGAVIKNNVMVNHSSPASGIRNDGASGLDITNNSTTASPGFVAALDFHLRATSPLIDKGATLATVTNDYDGKSRPQGVAFDIGAYEF